MCAPVYARVATFAPASRHVRRRESARSSARVARVRRRESARSRRDVTPSAYAHVVPTARRARIDDVHELALAMPHVTVVRGTRGQPGLPGGWQVVHLLPQRSPRRGRPGDRRALSRRDRVLGRSPKRTRSPSSRTSRRRSSRPRTSTDTCPSFYVAAGSESSTATSWPRWCRTPGWRVPRSAVRRTGCRLTEKPPPDGVGFSDTPGRASADGPERGLALTNVPTRGGERTDSRRRNVGDSRVDPRFRRPEA